jgi:hypothetical protein
MKLVTEARLRTKPYFLIETRFGSLCGIVIRVPGCRTEMYCVSCEVRTEFMYVM